MLKMKMMSAEEQTELDPEILLYYKYNAIDSKNLIEIQVLRHFFKKLQHL